MECLLDSSPDLEELLNELPLTADWYDIGGRLGVNSNKLNEIYFSQHSGEYKLSRMYQLWLGSKAEKATRRQLIEVLENKGLRKQALDYKKSLEQRIKNTTQRPPEATPTPTPPESTESMPSRMYIVAVIIIAVLVFIIVRSPPPDSRTSIPVVIEQYGSELCEKYNETLTKYKDAKYNKYPTAGPHVPFIPLISIVVKNVTKSTAEWLLSTTPNDIIQNELKIKIEDILKPVSEQQLKFVLIEGEPGIGKSTLAKELVLRWANKSDKLLSNYDIAFLIQLRFETYHNVLFITPDFQWSCNATSENPFLKLTKLNRLGMLAVNLHENDFARLEQLISPGRPLKIVLMENYGTPYNNILNIIKMQTSLEELTIQDGVDAHKHGTETFISLQSLEPPAHQRIIWTKSTNNLMVDYFEKFFYHIKIRKLPTIQLSSFTSFTYIKSMDMWGRWTR
ncbi:PREDICTED: uncharacterized protein LOC109590876, partial [Amphimedon queenslandica]|uniref:Death domain-containing protein n=2 Tax=Amphimedon queenslandica TaxID=400682 RepID=A0AAN0JZD7_AMPQE